MNKADFQRKDLSRREFLRNTGAALVTGAIGTHALGGFAAGAPAPRAEGGKASEGNGFERAGIWHFHPSVFEYSLGPWQPYRPSNPDLVTLWKKTIDWYADNGLDYIVLHVAPYGGEANPSPIRPDQVRFGWGYHYVLDFKKFPEGKVFEEKKFPGFVKRNQEIVRAVTEYGKEKGVDVFFHHYNFMMTKPFLDAHPELMRFEFLRKGNFVDLSKERPSDFRINPHGRQGDDLPWAPLILNVCWNKELYRDYMVACFQEFFEQVPAAAGILVTPGERANCQCVYCVGEHATEKEAADYRYRNSSERRKTIANFCEVFSKTLNDMGKTPLIRSWINGVPEDPETWAAALPKGPIYAMKYSVFDMTNTGADPIITAFQKAGHNLWLMIEHVGSENAGTVVMTVPDAFDKIAAECRKAGVKGVMGVDNAEGGFSYKSRRVQYVPEILFANSFGLRRNGTPDEVARGIYADIFGGPAPEILKAVELYSQLPYNIDRVIGTKHEGFGWACPYHFAPFPNIPIQPPPRQTGWPGALGDPGLDPPEWMRQEVVPFGKYVKYVEGNPWNDGKFRAEITGEGKDPIVFLEGFMRDARKALEALQALAPKVPDGAREEMKMLQDSAQLSYLTGVKWTSFLSARLYYAGASGPGPAEKRRDLGRMAVEEYGKGLEAAEKIVPIVERFPKSVCDVDRMTGALRRDAEKRRKELGYLKADLALVLDGVIPPKPPAGPPRGGQTAPGADAESS